MPTTIRTELDACGFDWEDGTILYQDLNTRSRRGQNTRVLDKTDKALDVRVTNGHEFNDFPRVMAFDAEAVYIIYQDNHGTSIVPIFTDPQKYLEEPDCQLPFPEA